MKSYKTNPQLIAIIYDLKARTRNTNADIWRDIALRLEKPRGNWAEVNLSKLERYVREGETVIVPGKVLAAGNISKKITVAAYSFSKTAIRQISNAGGRTLSIEGLADENPKGKGIRIIK